MNNNINNQEFKNTELYKKFISENRGKGTLIIRASAAGGAIPIENLGIEVTKEIENTKVIFFQGKTDESGMIKNIELPAPIQDPNNLDVPQSTIYNITATYPQNKTILKYSVSIYDKIHVLQNINIIPEISERGKI